MPTATKGLGKIIGSMQAGYSMRVLEERLDERLEAKQDQDNGQGEEMDVDQAVYRAEVIK